MDSHAPSATALAPWRTATLVASAIAAVELVLLVVAGVALLAPALSNHAKNARAAPAPKRQAKERPPKAQPAPVERAPRLSRAETPILVLNGNGVSGAAGAEAAEVRGLGYAVSAVANASRSDYPTSLVMYRPGYRPEGRRLARDLGVRVVGPLDGMRPRELGRAKVALVVGAR